MRTKAWLRYTTYYCIPLSGFYKNKKTGTPYALPITEGQPAQPNRLWKNLSACNSGVIFSIRNSASGLPPSPDRWRHPTVLLSPSKSFFYLKSLIIILIETENVKVWKQDSQKDSPKHYSVNFLSINLPFFAINVILHVNQIHFLQKREELPWVNEISPCWPICMS